MTSLQTPPTLETSEPWVTAPWLTAPWVTVTATAAAVGSCLVAGVFFAFSGFVMPALRRLPSAEGLAAMQSINRTATQPPLMIAMFGTALLCLVLGVAVARSAPDSPAARWLLAGAVLYLLFGIVVTGVANVPLNDTLAAIDPRAAGAAADWRAFAADWTAWNHVRTAGCFAATACLVVGLLQRR